MLRLSASSRTVRSIRSTALRPVELERRELVVEGRALRQPPRDLGVRHAGGARQRRAARAPSRDATAVCTITALVRS